MKSAVGVYFKVCKEVVPQDDGDVFFWCWSMTVIDLLK